MFREDEDFYIKINDGEIVTENKSDSIDFIKENTIPEQVDDTPHYNSPEYAEYINRMNRESLREINSEDINNIEATSNIRKEIKEKYPKKKVQLCIFALIIVLFIAIVAVSGSMMKSVSNTNMQLSVVNEEFKFLTDVVIASASDSIDSYDSLKELASTKDKLGYSEYKERIQSIKENAQRNLNDVNSLSSYIEVKNYKEIISCLEERYVNLINLCDSLLEARSENTINTYNKYVPQEVSVIGNLNNAIIEKAEELNIDYKVENEKIILNID